MALCFVRRSHQPEVFLHDFPNGLHSLLPDFPVCGTSAKPAYWWQNIIQSISGCDDAALGNAFIDELPGFRLQVQFSNGVAHRLIILLLYQSQKRLCRGSTAIVDLCQEEL